MTKPNGVHHLAISTANIKKQIEFFTDVLGMELVALYHMHKIEGAWHGFLRLNDQCSLAFVAMPAIAWIPVEIGRTHAANGALPSAPGTLQHLAFNVDTMEELLTMRDRIRSRGVHVFGEIDHGMCKSIYFAGPENLTLEVATSEGRGIEAEEWIDPEVVALAGISPAELARFKSPPRFDRPASPVAQPPAGTGQPEMVFPAEVYAQMLATPDEACRAAMSVTDPPVARPLR
jgi:catechol 2,3-dioxygenase-like lactoylglutathione lyase family enzyme